MLNFNNEFVTVGESEDAIRFAISQGESLLNYGTDDLSEERATDSNRPRNEPLAYPATHTQEPERRNILTIKKPRA